MSQVAPESQQFPHVHSGQKAFAALPDRDKLIAQYLPLVRSTAQKFRRSLPPAVETDDLVSAGLFGLMDAIERFDPSIGVKFSIYCAMRLRGAVIDELRALGNVPRAVLIRARTLEATYQALERKLSRAPTDEELARAAGMTLSEMITLQTQAAGTGSLSLAQVNAQGDELADWALNVLTERKVPQPEEVLHREEVRALVRSLIQSLPRMERLVLVLYYYEQLTMKQIGQILSLSESRVCQIHSDVLRRLQLRLHARKSEFFGSST